MTSDTSGVTSPRTALVTGASRGIGRAIAVALADSGFDLAITARTLTEGTGVATDDPNRRPLPGSLESTAAEVAARGRRVVPIQLDLLDRDRLVPAATEAIEALGHIDVLVNNAIWVGPGNDTRFLDTDLDHLEHRIVANTIAQLFITRPVLSAMIDHGGGTIVNITSGAGYLPTVKPVDQGSWSLGYGMAKAGFHRMAEILAVEYGDAGLRVLNVQPGAVATERVLSAGGWLDWVRDHAVPPEVIAEVVAWLVDAPADAVPNGSTVEAQDLARELGFLAR